MMDLTLRRRYFAEELEAVCRLRSAQLVDAFAMVPREQYLGPGPWTVLAESPFMQTAGAAAGTGLGLRVTPDADPGRVYHNIAVAIDPARQLFNGQPGTLAVWIDTLDLAPGARVLHVGTGLGYYTAVIAQAVGPSGRVVAYEVDEALAAGATRNLASTPWVDVRCGDSSDVSRESFDAIMVNAGVTHPLDVWLDALAPGGRMILPLTSTMPAMGSTLGKGLVFVLTKQDDASLAARVLTVVAVYSAIGLRDEQLSAVLGKAMMGGPMRWQEVKRLRRDRHDPDASCWLHASNCCLSTT
jgi:protein-L-isoaspartate(D-aspartate) O-methyltransferase